MRDLIDLIEGAVSSMTEVIGQPSTMTLKDGTEAMVTISREMRDGDECIFAEAHIDDKFAGYANFYVNRVPEWDSEAVGSLSASIVSVNKEYRRLGIATALYDAVVRAGFKITRSGQFGGKLSPDGSALWDSRVEWKKKRGQLLGTPHHPRFWKPTA
jgi:GNAT superfamily N-acetyltransferase